MSKIDANLRQLAAVAFGEASILNNSEEVGGIAFAVANRARAWKGKSIAELFLADKNYAYAITKNNERYQIFMKASDTVIQENSAMALALEWAKKALANETPDPSNGAFWWDGEDIKTRYMMHAKVNLGIHFSIPEHNILNIKNSSPGTITIYWQALDKRAKKLVNTTVRGRYDYVYVSTAAHGRTIFWKYNPDYVTATGTREYR